LGKRKERKFFGVSAGFENLSLRLVSDRKNSFSNHPLGPRKNLERKFFGVLAGFESLSLRLVSAVFQSAVEGKLSFFFALQGWGKEKKGSFLAGFENLRLREPQASRASGFGWW
jgi:hypothetical protein